MVVSLDGPAMEDGAVSVGFPGRQGFKRVKTTIPDEVRFLIMGLQKAQKANHAMQTTPNGAPAWLPLDFENTSSSQVEPGKAIADKCGLCNPYSLTHWIRRNDEGDGHLYVRYNPPGNVGLGER